jgi:GT2 family glycosyltransferase
MKPELSIIIINWNVKEYLRECLKSIYSKVGEAVMYEIIVIDNASNDGSSDMIKKEFPKVKLVQNWENIGFGRACNQASHTARGTFLLILNPDTKIIKVDFKELFRILEERNDIGAIVPLIYDKDGSLKYKVIRTIPKIRDVFNFYIFHQRLRFKYSKALSVTDVQEHEYPSGSCFLVKLSLFKMLGGFDEHYFLFFEDADLGVRLNTMHLKTISFPEFKIIHMAGKSTEQNMKYTFLSGHQSSLYFFKKTNGTISYIVIKFILVVGALIEITSLIIKYFLRSNNLNIIKWHMSHSL